MKIRISFECECNFESDNISEDVMSQGAYEKNYIRRLSEELNNIFLTDEVKNGNLILMNFKQTVIG